MGGQNGPLWECRSLPDGAVYAVRDESRPLHALSHDVGVRLRADSLPVVQTAGRRLCPASAALMPAISAVGNLSWSGTSNTSSISAGA